MLAADKIAKLLRCSPETISRVEKQMEAAFKKAGVLDKILEENKQRIGGVFRILGISEGAKAGEIFDALVSKVECDDHDLAKVLGSVNFSSKEDCDRLGRLAANSAGNLSGLFLKIDKAKEFLLKEPPKNSMNLLGYSDMKTMLEKEDVFEIYASLRFIEEKDWLNNVFFKQYESLAPPDFEEREIICRGLHPKWAKAAEKFVTKKYHNISHLKELGFIFIIPIQLGASGELLRNFSLLLHYFHEVEFYSDIFRGFADKKENFADNLISSFRGDVPECESVKEDKNKWLIIQRYLAKDDLFDLRMFVPHVNSEAIHWHKAEDDLAKISLNGGSPAAFMEFWKDMNWVGDYFLNGNGGQSVFKLESTEELIGFNLVDIAMSLVKEKELIKYLYHQQEALWNKIFLEYVGADKFEKIIKENWLKGHVEL